MTTAPRKRHFPALTGIRAVAAFWVVLYHFRDELYALPHWEPMMNVIKYGYLGVDLFFILSGFIIAYTYSDQLTGTAFKWRKYTAYLQNRLARIYPVHLFTIVLFLLVFLAGRYVGAIGDSDRFALTDLMQHLLLVHAWQYPTLLTWNGPSWSISSEWLAYLVFPLFNVLSLRIQRTAPAVVTILVMITVMTGIIVALNHDRTSAYALFRILPEFMTGVLLYRLHAAGWLKKAPWALIITGAVVGITIFSQLIGDRHTIYIAIVPLLAVIIYGLSWDVPVIDILLANSAALYLGRVSYSLYMVHDLVRVTGRELLPLDSFSSSSLLVQFSVPFIYILVALGGAALTFHLIEEPARKRFRARSA